MRRTTRSTTAARDPAPATPRYVRPLRAAERVLAFLVLFPIYITVVNSLLTPEPDRVTAAHALPDRPDLGHVLGTAWNAGHMGEYLKNSFVMTGDHRALPAGDRDARGLCVRVPRVPVQAHALRRVPRDAHDPVRGHDHHEPHHRVDLGIYDTYAGLADPVPRDRLRSVPAPPGVPARCPRDLKDAAALDGYGHLRFLARVVVPLSRPAIAALGGLRVPLGVEPVPLAAARDQGRPSTGRSRSASSSSGTRTSTRSTSPSRAS